MTQECANAAETSAPKSKLLKRRLPKFEVPRDYASFAAGSSDEGEAEKVFEAAFKAQKEAAENTNRTSAETLDAIITCIGAQNALREILYKTLCYCGQTKSYEEVEEFISKSDEYVYSHIIQSPYSLVQMLKKCGGLVERCYMEDGTEMTAEVVAEMSADEIEDKTESITLTTSPEGLKACELVSPDKRFRSLINQRPHRAETFYALMELCLTPRTFPEIKTWYEETPGLAVDTVQAQHTLAADFYVDKLDKAAMLVWRGKWVTTEEGREILQQHQSSEK